MKAREKQVQSKARDEIERARGKIYCDLRRELAGFVDGEEEGEDSRLRRQLCVDHEYKSCVGPTALTATRQRRTDVLVVQIRTGFGPAR